MTRATLTETDSGGIRQLVLDCPHGTTTVTTNGVPRQLLVSVAVATHKAEEGCDCASSIAAENAGHASN